MADRFSSLRRKQGLAAFPLAWAPRERQDNDISFVAKRRKNEALCSSVLLRSYHLVGVKGELVVLNIA